MTRLSSPRELLPVLTCVTPPWIFEPSKIAETRPDYILILPWNLREEIMSDLAYVREWGAKFVVPIPETTVYD